ncbi:hypothetical protein HYDPIDRAFT_182204 [Hydnomerulius pinastri MD-312]|uniref:SPIN90/Ldb17 leucine-rich domain-containing protein n=1 Tax=Hydnomerulius pinastri MD-312 TaxID=994086 RepID=A0A0C9W852_9AGAM|nr:hypothetical protein HYDPIDRAFT_182204 [Hydnomerulius pinastri MD-312]
MMVQTLNSEVNLLAEDDFGIIYFIENAQQFWSELDDVLRLPSDGSATLSMLDTTLRRFISLCASYHEQYLQSPLQLEHACQLLLDSELFTFHSERMCELAIGEVQSKTDPHWQLMVYNILLFWGRRQSAFLRNQKRWQPLIPLLMDHILVEIDPDTEDIYLGAGSSSSGHGSRSSIIMGPIVIEAKLRRLSARLLYEVCRVQKLSEQDLRVFSDTFIDNLFELVEQTRFMPDDSFNYSVIKLIVALNEQFMVAGLTGTAQTQGKAPEVRNRVMEVLISRLGSSKTFGENMIFMLNRASRSAEDLCMQLLVLKLLYILFTHKATSEYFYTNDLCVLVDVFLRELVDLDDESESLRHTYLRVLHPLLTKTQLRDIPYKRPQIVMALESLTQNANIRDINPTTKRLVERCLSGEWCVQLRKTSFDKDLLNSQNTPRQGSPSHDILASTTQDAISPSQPSVSANLERASDSTFPAVPKLKHLKSSRSVENLKGPLSPKSPPLRSATEGFRRPSTDSAKSLGGVASATAIVPKRREKSGSVDNGSLLSQQAEKIFLVKDHPHPPPSPGASSLPPNSSTLAQKTRRPPPPPPTRRKPPPLPPVGKTHGGAIITAIASSASSPALSQFGKSSRTLSSDLPPSAS